MAVVEKLVDIKMKMQVHVFRCMAASSASMERTFFNFGNVQSKLRNKLGIEKTLKRNWSKEETDWIRHGPLDGWSYNTLHRATVVGQRTYERTRSRNVEWPKQKPPCMPVQDVEEPFVYTSLDEAFSTVLQFMSQTTKQCKKYYKSNPPSNTQEIEQRHCNRFHTSRDTTTQGRKPVNSSAYRQTDRHVSRPEYIPTQYI